MNIEICDLLVILLQFKYLAKFENSLILTNCVWLNLCIPSMFTNLQDWNKFWIKTKLQLINSCKWNLISSNTVTMILLFWILNGST